MSEKPLARCMGGRFCNHQPGTCTATAYQAERTQPEQPADLVRTASRAVHEFLCHRGIMKYLDNDEDCEGIAKAVLAAIPTASQECPSCGGLNTSCPIGCGRDESGQLDGSTLVPRRRVEVSIKIGADSWDDLRRAIRCIETDLARDGQLSRSSVSGGYSFGWIIESNEREDITHDSWAEANERYCAAIAKAGK